MSTPSNITHLCSTRVSIEEGGVTRECLSLYEKGEEEEGVSNESNADTRNKSLGHHKSHNLTSRKQMNSLLELNEKSQGSLVHPSSPMESPVTVALAPFWKSSISVEDTGATEVTLEDSKDKNSFYKRIESVLTPSKTRRQSSQLDFDPTMMDNSLLDGNLVLPDSPDTPMKTPFCGLYGCFPILPSPHTQRKDRKENHQDDDRLSAQSNFHLHGCILNSLSSCEDGESWQSMLPGPTHKYPERVGEDDDENALPSAHRMRVMHNRAMHAHSKSDRLQDLKRNLHPFGQSSGTSDRRLLRVNTFTSSPRTKRGGKGARTVEHLQTPTKMGWQAWSCNPTVSPSPSKKLTEVDLNACYDSDPECYQDKRNFRRSSTDLSSTGSKVRTGQSASPCNVNDELAMHEMVESVFKERWTLIYHPERGTPVGVDAWLERGQRLSTATIPPKIMWLPLHEKGKKHASQDGPNFTAVELLDIQRILDVNRVDRETFPFAKPRRTFVIKSLSGTYCLEARSMADRNRLVRQLKLTVARFGSQLVSGDNGVEDFFVPLTHNQPSNPHHY